MPEKPHATFNQVKNIPVIRQLVQNEKKQIRKINTLLDRANKQHDKKLQKSCKSEKQGRQNKIHHYEKTLYMLGNLKRLEKQQEIITLNIAQVRRALLKN